MSIPFMNMSAARLGELIAAPDKTMETFFVFNPLGWIRTDYCDYPYNGSSEISVIDLNSSREVPVSVYNQGKY